MVVHPNLRRFLRHQAEDLALAHELRRAMPVEAFSRFLAAWEKGLGARLHNEVRQLAPLGTPRLAARLMTNVGALRDFAEMDRRLLCDGQVRELGARLEDYLLWKERELLPMLEVVATPPELDRLSRTRPPVGK
ncbi:MAG: hypothetical protein ACO1SV_05660 [Fimbriimonas sp.]